MPEDTLSGQLARVCAESADAVWLRDRKGDQYTDWTFGDAQAQIDAVAAWLEKRFGASGSNIVLLSRNRAHWFLADMAIIGSGNVSIPMFTTLPPATAKYVIEFTDAKALILGETQNWDAVREVLPDSVEVITLPGVDIDDAHTTWSDIVSQSDGEKPAYVPKHDDMISMVFTSGTTGVPKGVMQSHDSMLIPMQRSVGYFTLDQRSRFLSYLPLSHIAERQLVFVNSLIYTGVVTFNESLETLLRDMADTKPSFFFGAPRVWEQLQQGVLAKFGSQEALDAALGSDPEGVGLSIRNTLGFNDIKYMLTAAAPTPPSLIEWYGTLGMTLMEGFGQTEIMATAVNTHEARKIGSIGRVADGVELNISDAGELLFKADGAALGYYKMPEKTAETFVDGWVHTGDKGYIDDDGFVFITGRVKDYFKTIQGKFVAPPPIEGRFGENPWTEQLCLLGRGYSKTVMVCVLSDLARQQDAAIIEKSMLEQVQDVNENVEKHARIGAVIISNEPWTIENEFLTPTLKIRREMVEGKYGEPARQLAQDAAVNRDIIVQWAHDLQA